MPSINSKFNNPCLDVMIASYKNLDGIWDEARLGRKWLSLANYDLETTVQVIKDALIDTTTEKHLVVQVFQKFIGYVDVQILINHMNDIADIAKAQTLNKVAFSTMWFAPAMEKYWRQVAIFNRAAHRANESLRIPRVNIHRAIMSQIDPETDQSLCIRPAMWQEYQLGWDLGLNLSYEGQQKVSRYVQKVFDTVFGRNAFTGEGRPTRVTVPPSLAVTSGYENNRYMMQRLEEKGIIRSRTKSAGSRRDRRLEWSDQRLPGWRYWKVFQEHGTLWNINCREGILEAHLYMINKSDEMPVWGSQVGEDREEETVDKEPVSDNKSEEDERQTECIEGRVEKESVNNDERDEEERQVEDIESDEDEVFEDEKGEKEKERKENSIERDNCTTKLLKLARNKIKDSERVLSVANEKLKAYKADISKKDEMLAKERGACRHWKTIAERAQNKYDDLLNQLHKLKVELKAKEKEHNRVVVEYEYLRGIYESEKDRPQRIKITRQIAKNRDFRRYSEDRK